MKLFPGLGNLKYCVSEGRMVADGMTLLIPSVGKPSLALRLHPVSFCVYSELMGSRLNESSLPDSNPISIIRIIIPGTNKHLDHA